MSVGAVMLAVRQVVSTAAVQDKVISPAAVVQVIFALLLIHFTHE
jgi:hypothetical protein